MDAGAGSDPSLTASFLDQLDVGLWSVAGDTGCTLYVNDALLRITGRTREELAIAPASLIPWMHPDDRAGAQLARRAAFAGQVDGAVWRLLRPDGEVRWLRFRSRPEGGTPGTPERIDVLIEDVTASRKAETALAQARLETALAEERERLRLAVALHDRLGQTLALAQIKAGLLRPHLPDEGRATLAELGTLLAAAVDDIRNMTFELSPPLLRELGLHAALLSLADQLAARHGLHVEIEGSDPALDVHLAGILFRVIRELLVNTAKHAGCAEARVLLLHDAAQVSAYVTDAGVGFDPAAAPAGFGLASAREQVARLGGALEISSQPGAGVVVRVRVPLPAPAKG